MVSLLRFPKPRSLLHFVSLRTASEFINLTLLINKVTGFYGILALFTGYHLNWLQLSHYVYSLVILGLVAWLVPAIRRPDQPLRNVALAWIYILDTVVNSAYTALFGTGWFFLLSQHLQEPGKDNPIGGSAATMKEAAGFTDPKANVTQVDVIAKPAAGLLAGQEAVAYGHSQSSLLSGAAVLESDSMTSIALLALFTLVRVYFCIIVMSYARSILRQYVANMSTSATAPFPSSDPNDPTMAPNPFEVDGGWQCKLGRILLRFPSRRYWLGREEQDSALSEWERTTSGRFAESAGKALRIKVPGQENGVGERERRARSGTGPPPPPPKKLPE